jgi:signal peptidase I
MNDHNLKLDGDISRYSRLALHITRSDQASDKPVMLQVVSGSMSPLLQPGDSIYMEFTPPESLKRGDIVVFHKGDTLVTHRLISISPRGCLTKGDALLRCDPPIDRTDIAGRVVAFDHKGKVIRLAGWRWRVLNRMSGLFGSLEAQAVFLGDKIIRRDRWAHMPAWFHFLIRSGSWILRAPAMLLIKLFAP